MEALGIKWTPELRKVSDLKKWEKNPRKISESARAALKQKIVSEGMHQVITIDTDNTVLSGNQRLDILIELGRESVWCMVPERSLASSERDRVGIESNLNDGMWDLKILSLGFEVPMLKDFGFTSLQMGLRPESVESDSSHQASCPHCGGRLRLSNRVKKIEKM